MGGGAPRRPPGEGLDLNLIWPGVALWVVCGRSGAIQRTPLVVGEKPCVHSDKYSGLTELFKYFMLKIHTNTPNTPI